MNTSTRVALVLLRLAIGWHFLFEGVAKLESHFHGGSETKPLWTSEPYLRGATGPFADVMRQPLGDPDADALDRLTLPAPEPGKLAKLPPALEKDWQEQFDRFVAHYKVGTDKTLPPEYVGVLAVTPQAGLPGVLPWPALQEIANFQPSDQLQLTLAKADFEHAKAEAIRWLESGSKDVEKKFSKVDEKVKWTTRQRVDAYRKKVEKVHEIETVENPAFGQDVWKKKLPELKKEVAKARKELLDDANQPLKNTMDFVQKQRLTNAQRNLAKLPEEQPFRWITWIDRVTMWGLAVVGGCLLLGLFTRLSCVLAAAFMLSLYLTMPPWPWLPQDPTSRSHFLFVNLNLIEMLALLALATTASGKWLGLDGLVQFLNPFRSRKPSAPKQPVPHTNHANGLNGPRGERPANVHSPVKEKEPVHGP